MQIVSWFTHFHINLHTCIIVNVFYGSSQTIHPWSILNHHTEIFSTSLAMCQLLQHFCFLLWEGVLGPSTCFLFKPGRLTAAWEEDWCTFSNSQKPQPHTHCITYPVNEISVSIHIVPSTVILYLLQFVSSVTVSARRSLLFPPHSHKVLLQWLLVPKHLIAFLFSVLLIVMSGSHTRSCFYHLVACACLVRCVWETNNKVAWGKCGFSPLPGYWVQSSARELLMALALLADMSVVLGVASHRAHSSVVKYL